MKHLGAFVPGERVELPGAVLGPLGGLLFAAKDVIDIEGHVTGCGNPDWRRTHRPAERHAAVVSRLVDAGASLAGRTVTDELAYSLLGCNVHDGTPVNPGAPGRIPGGSSAGSASAVAGGAVDFALGTDTGGSVRIPAALCGVWGFRPTHGVVALDGVVPLAPSFDTLGWMARDATILRRVGEVLMPAGAHELASFIILEDALEVADPEILPVIESALNRLVPPRAALRRVWLTEVVDPGGGGLAAWAQVFRSVQAWEAWREHGTWLTNARPRLAPDVAARFAWASNVSEDNARRATARREGIASGLHALLGGGVFLLPTAPSIAPHLAAGDAALARFRERALMLTSIAGLAGLPQVSLPIGLSSCLLRGDRAPVGLSLIAGRGKDVALLRLAEALSPRLE